MNIGDEYEVVQDEKAPKGRRIIKKAEAVKAEVTKPNTVATFAPKRGRPSKSKG